MLGWLYSWLFNGASLHYKDDELTIVHHTGVGRYYYIGSYDALEGSDETLRSLDALGDTIDATFGFRDNGFLPTFDRVGLALKELGYDVTNTVGLGRAWYFDRGTSKVFISVACPSTVVEVHRNRARYDAIG